MAKEIKEENYIVVFGSSNDGFEPGEYVEYYTTLKMAFDDVYNKVVSFIVDSEAIDIDYMEDFDNYNKYRAQLSKLITKYESYAKELEAVKQQSSDEEKFNTCRQILEKFFKTRIFFTGNKKVTPEEYKTMIQTILGQIISQLNEFQKQSIRLEKEELKQAKVKTSSELEEKKMLKELLQKHGIPAEFLKCNR